MAPPFLFLLFIVFIGNGLGCKTLNNNLITARTPYVQVCNKDIPSVLQKMRQHLYSIEQTHNRRDTT